MARERSYSEGLGKKRMGSADFGSQVPENSGMAMSCDPGAEPGLRKIGK
jgi:hypothetical protein